MSQKLSNHAWLCKIKFYKWPFFRVQKKFVLKPTLFKLKLINKFLEQHNNLCCAFYILSWAFFVTGFFFDVWILAIFRHFWKFLSHFFISFRAFTHQKLFPNQGLYVYKKMTTMSRKLRHSAEPSLTVFQIKNVAKRNIPAPGVTRRWTRPLTPLQY